MPRRLVYGHAASWLTGRLWHGSNTDWLPCVKCDGSKQAKTGCGRVEGAPAKRKRQKGWYWQRHRQWLWKWQ